MKENLILSGSSKDLGDFSVVRVLPHIKKRQVGPFVFLDHMGPMIVDKTHLLSVRPHPHIGLATLTYLFEGRGHHRDSLGSNQIITPGDLNWMTAGRGIVHSERTPEDELKPSVLPRRIHGIQFWIGLPKDHEECEPSFIHYPKSVLPDLKISNSLIGKLLIGSYQGLSSPVKTFSSTVFIELFAQNNGEEILSFNNNQYKVEATEIGLFLVSGECSVGHKQLKMNDLLVVSDPSKIKISFAKETRIIIIGGEVFPEPRYIWWNFVSSNKERIRNAALAWKNQTMGKVLGENDFIPLPNELQLP